MTREDLRNNFLHGSAWKNATIHFLAGDCSYRTYYRLQDGEKTAILMDAYGEQEKVKEFAKISALLNTLGCTAPSILQSDFQNRFLLLEDLGDQTFTRCLKEGMTSETLYEVAIDALIHLHKFFDPAKAKDLPVYNAPSMMEKLELFLQHYYPHIHGVPPSQECVRLWESSWEEALSILSFAPKTLLLMDFHVDNLLWLPHREGIKRCGLLDFQDASFGPNAYDLVSLLEDARQDVSEEMTQRLLGRYLNAFPLLDKESFLAQYYTVGAQRICRIMGVFTRMFVQRNRPHYLGFLPRTWKWLENDLKHDNLESVRFWFNQYFPEETRSKLKCS